MPILSQQPSTRSILIRALVLGASAGLRSATPIGILARNQPNARQSAEWTRWPLFRSDAGRKFIQLAWIGELFADKSPVIPPRINPGPIAGRIAFGAIAGLAVGTERHGVGPKIGGMVAGALGAVVGAYAGYHARTSIVESTGLPDTAVALVEDVKAAAIAQVAIQS